MGVENRDVHEHDSKTLKTVLASADENRKIPVLTAVVDQGYRGVVSGISIESASESASASTSASASALTSQ